MARIQLKQYKNNSITNKNISLTKDGKKFDQLSLDEVSQLKKELELISFITLPDIKSKKTVEEIIECKKQSFVILIENRLDEVKELNNYTKIKKVNKGYIS